MANNSAAITGKPQLLCKYQVVATNGMNKPMCNVYVKVGPLGEQIFDHEEFTVECAGDVVAAGFTTACEAVMDAISRDIQDAKFRLQNAVGKGGRAPEAAPPADGNTPKRRGLS